MIKLAIVSPCYNEEDVLWRSAERLTALYNEMVEDGRISHDSVIVFVNDGSKDRTWETIERLHQQNSFVRGINLTRNVGHQNAIMAGMMTAREWADAVVTIDVDLQDDLQAIPRMVDDFVAGNEIVYGVKVSRQADPLLKRFSAQAFYKLQSAMGVDSIFNHADFRLMSRRALDMLSGYQERNLYLRGLIPLMGLQSTTEDDIISSRESGQSKYTLKKMLGLALDGITSFSVRPIYGIIYLGLFVLMVSLAIGVYVIRAIIVGTAVPGWASLILSVWLTSGFLMISVGIVGIYIGKIYTEVKHRPLYNIKEILE